MKLSITSNYGRIESPLFYVGWKCNPDRQYDLNDCGDEVFGICINNYYIGYYEDNKWASGFLNENGCLN